MCVRTGNTIEKRSSRITLENKFKNGLYSSHSFCNKFNAEHVSITADELSIYNKIMNKVPVLKRFCVNNQIYTLWYFYSPDLMSS